MSEEIPVPEMRPFAMSLLVEAAGNARTTPQHRNLIFNAAFRYGVELAGELPTHAENAARGDFSFGGWLSDEAGDDFFVLSGRLLDAVEARIRGRHAILKKSREDEPSAYDHAALMALGQTFCRAGEVRQARFPTVPAGLAAIARCKPRALQQIFVADYLGNVLQDFFDASQIRAEFPSLPPDTEDTLRKEEATELTAAVFAAITSSDHPVEIAPLHAELQEMVGRVWLADKALDD